MTFISWFCAGLVVGITFTIIHYYCSETKFHYITEFQYMSYKIHMYRLEIHVKNLFYAEVWHGMTKQTTGLYMDYNDAVKAGHDLASNIQGSNHNDL